jgi:hypothetical protein
MTTTTNSTNSTKPLSDELHGLIDAVTAYFDDDTADDGLWNEIGHAAIEFVNCR